MPACEMASEVVSQNRQTDQQSEGKNSVWSHFCAGTSVAPEALVTKLEQQLGEVTGRATNLLRKMPVIDRLETSLKTLEEDIRQLRNTCKEDITFVKRQMTCIRTQSSAPAQNEQALGVSELAQKMQELSSSLSSRMLQLESSLAVLQPALSLKETATADIGKEYGHGDLDIDEASPQLAQVCKQTDSDKEKLEALEALEAAGLGKSIGRGCTVECLAFLLCFTEVRRLISHHERSLQDPERQRKPSSPNDRLSKASRSPTGLPSLVWCLFYH